MRQIPRRTLAFCEIQPFAAPNAGKLTGIIRPFRGYWGLPFQQARFRAWSGSRRSVLRIRFFGAEVTPTSAP